MDIELKEKGADGAGGGSLARKSEEDVAILVHEVEDVFGGQGGTEACILGSIDWTLYQLNQGCLPLDLGGRIRRWS